MADTEGAKFWIRSPRKADMYNHFLAVQGESLMNVLTDIKNHGTNDILIACMDVLTSFPDALTAVFSDTRIQHCIVHMIRSSTKFVSYKDLKQVCRDLFEDICALAESRNSVFFRLLNNEFIINDSDEYD